MKKMITTGLSVFMTSVLLAGCSGGNAKSSNDAQNTDANSSPTQTGQTKKMEPATLKIMLPGDRRKISMRSLPRLRNGWPIR